MATKLKNILYSSGLQVVTAILAVICFASGLYFALAISYDENISNFGLDVLNDASQYEDSTVVYNSLGTVYSECMTILGNEGSTDPEDLQRVADAKNSLVVMEKENGLNWVVMVKGNTIAGSSGATLETIKKLPIHYIDNHGDVETTNHWAQYGLGNVSLSETSPLFATGSIDADTGEVSPSSGWLIAFGLGNTGRTTVDEAGTQYTAARHTMGILIQLILASALGGLICLVLGCFNEGHSPKDEGITLYPIDAYWDVNFCVAFMLFCLLFSGALGAYGSLPTYVSVLFCLGAAAGPYALAMSTVRLVKAHAFLDHLLILRLFWFLVGLAKSLWVAITDYYVQVVKGSSLVGLYFGFCAILYMIVIWSYQTRAVGIVFLPLLIIAGSFKVKSVEEIIRGVRAINEGEKDHVIPVRGKGLIPDFTQDINAMNQNMARQVDAAVDKELKSERLKTELLTNVSHDIRTPLTSIIAYVDILKQPNLPEADRQHYIEILEEKAKRLKTLTDNLFEAAKASTGNIDINLTLVDPMALVNQALGEFAERLEKAQLTVIVNRPEEKCMVMADGNQLWRVVDNLLSNGVKYAMAGSRIYITVAEEDNRGIIEVKNMSAESLNIPAEELMERFKRGDTARHTEGSGLGLAIARDLTELQGGSFSIDIDGDLFKARVSLPLGVVVEASI